MLRARNVPARLVAVYAPGLQPMDFHAVVEAAIDGEWRAVDATTLAPRQSLVRIATGRDASDTAFLTVQSGRADLRSMGVNATATPDLPEDDLTSLVSLT
jgi:transglutaminase-like putative cysteine protease